MSTPEEYPKILYKYRDWKSPFQKDVLLKNHLYLTSPKYFNDPFDCRIPVNFLLLDTKEKKELYATKFIERHSPFMLSKGANLKVEYDKLMYDLENNLDIYHKHNEDFLFEQQDAHYGVLSMSTVWDSILMWSHYSDFHKGVCYGFLEEKLRDSQLFGKGGPVHYSLDDRYPDIDPNIDYSIKENLIKRGFIETHTKSKEWEYEKEYRLFKLFFPQAPTNEDRIRKIPDDFFAEIILGINMPQEHKEEIIDIAKYKKIKIFQAKKVPFKFKIDREQIL